MALDYIPTRDGEMVAWMTNFAGRIAEGPGVYGLTPADAEHIGRMVGELVEAYGVAIDPGTRTAGAVAAKNEARNAAVQLCRAYAMLIKPNRGVANEDKILLGVRPMNPGRVAIHVPASSPLLKLVGATPGSHTLRFSDTSMPTRRAKPFGAAGLHLFVHVGERGQKVGPGDASLCGVFTKNPVGVGFEAKDGGKVATYFGRWVSRRGEMGPWSLPVAMHVVA